MAKSKKEEKIDFKKYAKTAGIVLIVLGLIHIALSGVLDAFWGVIIIILGIIALCYRVKQIILMVGIALVVVGVMNILASLVYFSVFWTVLGALQIYWGIQEIRRYNRIKGSLKVRKK